VKLKEELVQTVSGGRPQSSGGNDAMVCPRCGKREMIFYPMLGIYECLNCCCRK
jgi:hypothetical protein